MIERLLYRSKATSTLGSLHLFNLLSEARAKNAELNITGHLLYSKEIFVQCIEGPAESIESLWRSLQRDDRHYDIELLARGPIDQRRFSESTMAFSTYESLNRYSMPGFFPIDDDGMNEAVERCTAS
jgi:hypothetical protein